MFRTRIKTVVISTLAVLLMLPACRQKDYHSFKDERDKKVYSYKERDGSSWMTDNLHYLDNSIYYKGAWVFPFERNDYENALKKTDRCDSGVLYDWEMANKISPEGWKLPTVNDWKSLLFPIHDSLSPSLSDHNLIINGRARLNNKFCISSSITYWTADRSADSDNTETAIVMEIGINTNGTRQVKFREEDIENAFYVRCIMD